MRDETRSSEPTPPRMQRGDVPTWRAYAAVGVFLSAVGVAIAAICARATPRPMPVDALLAPMAGLALVTAVVWVVMVVVRNVAVMTRRIDTTQFVHYAGKDFDERIERPARAFSNLFEVPLLLYVACLAMMSTGRLDAAQLQLAWLFVGLRAAHATVYIGWNHLPTRFATWIAGCITLVVIWVRLVSA